MQYSKTSIPATSSKQSRDRKKSLQQTNFTELSETTLNVSTIRTNHQRTGILSEIEDVDHLKQVLNRCWSMLSQELMNGAIDQWSKRLSLVIRSHGGHIEHRFA